MHAVLDTQLPSPEEVQRQFDALRETILGHYDHWAHELDKAEAAAEKAQRQMDSLRERYPMFFPDAPKSAKTTGQPSLEQMNQALRVIAEHPNSTRKQLARRINYSPSWVSEIVKAIEQTGAFIKRGRHGREMTYSLTELGESTLNSGGLRA